MAPKRGSVPDETRVNQGLVYRADHSFSRNGYHRYPNNSQDQSHRSAGIWCNAFYDANIDRYHYVYFNIDYLAITNSD
jgi:hypothetical protein